MNLRQLVDRIETLLGPAATPDRVEELADVVIRAARGEFANGHKDGDAVDVAAVRLGVPLQHCASRLRQTVRSHAYDTLRHLAAPFRHVVNAAKPAVIAQETALHAVVSPVSLFTSALEPGDVLEVALSLEEAAEHAGLDRLYGFSSFLSPADPSAACSLSEALPQLLENSERLHASIDIGASLHPEIVWRLAALIGDIRNRRAESLRRLLVTVNAGPDRPLDGVFLPVTIRHPVIGLQLSGRAIIQNALHNVDTDAGLDEVQRAVRHEAFRDSLAASLASEELASRLASRLNQRVLSGSLLYTALSERSSRVDSASFGRSCACAPEDHALEKAIAQGVELASPGGGVYSSSGFRTISTADVASTEELEQLLTSPLQDLIERGSPGVLRFYP